MVTATGFTAEKFTELIGQTIVGRRIAGDNLIITLSNGTEIDAGNTKGYAAANPTATNLPFNPTFGIAATNVQAALAELGGDVTTLGTNKGDKTAVPNILSGRVTHTCDYGFEYETQATTVNYPNVFPSGAFITPPEVVVTPLTRYPDMRNADPSTGMTVDGVIDVTLRGFSIRAWWGPDPSKPEVITPLTVTYCWVALG